LSDHRPPAFDIGSEVLAELLDRAADDGKPLPPGGNGTTKRIVLDGNACARTEPETTRSAIARSDRRIMKSPCPL
jgi:hypothetical protein